MHSFLALENILKNSGSSNMDVELPPDIDSEMEFDTDIESEGEGFDIAELPPLIPFNCVDDISEIELPPDVDDEPKIKFKHLTMQRDALQEVL